MEGVTLMVGHVRRVDDGRVGLAVRLGSSKKNTSFCDGVIMIYRDRETTGEQ